MRKDFSDIEIGFMILAIAVGTSFILLMTAILLN
jgi:hypothetical protein